MDSASSEKFCEEAERATQKGKCLKFQRYMRNLKYNSEGICIDDAKISDLDLKNKTIKRTGSWSSTNFAYYYYAKGLLNIWYNVTEIESPKLKIPSLSYYDHT